ncbi:MAG: hypothetical protein HUK22_05105 [Thermoguttaceae bacterium]|nr:hypothetical protein [Thermoguttaceae bacterium]
MGLFFDFMKPKWFGLTWAATKGVYNGMDWFGWNTKTMRDRFGDYALGKKSGNIITNPYKVVNEARIEYNNAQAQLRQLEKDAADLKERKKGLEQDAALSNVIIGDRRISIEELKKAGEEIKNISDEVANIGKKEWEIDLEKVNANYENYLKAQELILKETLEKVGIKSTEIDLMIGSGDFSFDEQEGVDYTAAKEAIAFFQKSTGDAGMWREIKTSRLNAQAASEAIESAAKEMEYASASSAEMSAYLFDETKAVQDLVDAQKAGDKRREREVRKRLEDNAKTKSELDRAQATKELAAARKEYEEALKRRRDYTGNDLQTKNELESAVTSRKENLDSKLEAVKNIADAGRETSAKINSLTAAGTFSAFEARQYGRDNWQRTLMEKQTAFLEKIKNNTAPKQNEPIFIA